MLAIAKCLIVSIPIFLIYSSDESVNATNEFANNFGNVVGEISIHLRIKYMHYITSCIYGELRFIKMNVL